MYSFSICTAAASLSSTGLGAPRGSFLGGSLKDAAGERGADTGAVEPRGHPGICSRTQEQEGKTGGVGGTVRIEGVTGAGLGDAGTVAAAAGVGEAGVAGDVLPVAAHKGIASFWFDLGLGSRAAPEDAFRGRILGPKNQDPQV